MSLDEYKNQIDETSTVDDVYRIMCEAIDDQAADFEAIQLYDLDGYAQARINHLSDNE